MTTAAQAYAILKARLTSNKPAGLTALRFQNEVEDSNGDATLPDTPAAFAYVEFLSDRALLASFGGGRGANRYRNPARLDIFVLVPVGQGLGVALELAEACATLFRSYRDSSLSCFEATVEAGGSGADIKPPGLDSEAGNYFWAAVEVSLFYDLIG